MGQGHFSHFSFHSFSAPSVFVYLYFFISALFFLKPKSRWVHCSCSLLYISLSFSASLSLISNRGSLRSVDWLSSCSTRLCHPSWLAFIMDKGGLHTQAHTLSVLYPTEDPLQYPPLSGFYLHLWPTSISICFFFPPLFFLCYCSVPIHPFPLQSAHGWNKVVSRALCTCVTQTGPRLHICKELNTFFFSPAAEVSTCGSLRSHVSEL